jgi:hypothetical protein
MQEAAASSNSCASLPAQYVQSSKHMWLPLASVTSCLPLHKICTTAAPVLPKAIPVSSRRGQHWLAPQQHSLEMESLYLVLPRDSPLPLPPARGRTRVAGGDAHLVSRARRVGSGSQTWSPDTAGQKQGAMERALRRICELCKIERRLRGLIYNKGRRTRTSHEHA